jgi:nicotinamide mononucleotide transporter
MSAFEIFGSIFGFISVWLTVRASVWCWPTGIANILLLLVTYFQARLYGDVLNYTVMLAVCIWGWIAWVRRGPEGDRLEVRLATRRERLASLAAVAIGTPLMGWLFARYTDAALPWWDSLVNVLALVAQVLLARKLIENWILWILSDVIAIGVYLAKGLYVVTALYVAYVFICVLGIREWLAKARA